jgi:hypothetical protein
MEDFVGIFGAVPDHYALTPTNFAHVGQLFGLLTDALAEFLGKTANAWCPSRQAAG